MDHHNKYPICSRGGMVLHTDRHTDRQTDTHTHTHTHTLADPFLLVLNLSDGTHISILALYPFKTTAVTVRKQRR